MSDASRDAAAIVASLHKGDYDSALLLAGFYDNDLESSAMLSGALAAFATSVLSVIDQIGEEMRTTHGVEFPSSNAVLSSVLTRLAVDD
jgi:hypothetical protein